MGSPYIQDDTQVNNPLLNGDYAITDSALGAAVTSITSAGFLGIMGSLVDLGTTGAGTMSIQTFTFGQVAVPGNPTNFLRLAWTTGATAGTPKYTHKVENVRTFAGMKCTLQGFYRSNAAVPIKLRQDFGTGGSPSADVSSNPDGPINSIPSTVDADGTAQWRPFALTYNLPSIAGKTLGTTASTSYIGIDVLPSLNTIFQVDFARLRLIPAGERSPMVARRYGFEEEKLLARYYSTFAMFIASGGTSFLFPNGPMRAIPIMSGNLGASVTGSATLNGSNGAHSGTSAVITGITADARIAD